MATETEQAGAAQGMLGGGPTSADTAEAQPSAQPAPTSPNLSQTAGQNIESAATSQIPKQAPPSTPQPAPAAPTHLSTFDKILDVLGAKPKPTYTVDPVTKQLKPGEPAPMTTKQRLGMVVAAALTGLAASQQQPGRKTGLSTLATGAGAGIQMEEGQDAEAKKEAVQAYERQQQATQQAQEGQLRQAQIFETNQRTALLTRQTENAAEEARQHYIAASSPIIEGARTAAVGGVSALKREHLTQAQLLQEHATDGARHATTNIYVPDGEIEAIDPQTGEAQKNPDGSPRMEYTFSELDPNQTVDMDSDQLDQAVKNGMPVPGYTPGAGGKLRMPIGGAAQIVQFNQGVKNFEDLTDSINSKLGLKGKAALDADQIIARNPTVGQAFAKMAAHFDGQPANLENALNQMQKDPKLAPYARTVVTALGPDRVDEFNEAIRNEAAGTKKAAEEKAAEPFQEQKENRLAARQEARDEKKTHAHDTDLVIAGAPGSEDTQVMQKGNVPEGWNWYTMQKSEPSQLLATIRRTNDVQNKINMLARFVQKGGMDKVQAGLAADATAEMDNEFKLGVSHTELPTARINAILNQENYKAMGPETRDYVRLYGFAREAMTQLPALQSFGKSNRMNDTQLRAALQLLPDARMAGNSAAALDQMVQLQGILDPLRKLPTGLPGGVLDPAWNQSGGPANGEQAQPGATQGEGWFSKIKGAKLRRQQAAQPAATGQQ